MGAFDENQMPQQYGLEGFHRSGVTKIEGPIIGIVLSVHQADDKSGNRWYEMLDTQTRESKAPWHECHVWAVHGGMPLSFEIPHAVVMPSGKSSRFGPTEDELPDATEDVPEGSTTQEVTDFLEGRRGIESLSGDWVLLDFIGGLVQQAVVRTWYPNPFRLGEAGLQSDGARWRIRRKGTETKIDKNGDYTLTHRHGSFLQVRSDQLTWKHKDGAMFHMNEEGEILAASKDGTNIAISDGVVEATNGSASFVMDGNNIKVFAPNGNILVAGDKVDLTGDVSASGGPATTPQSLLTEALLGLQGSQFTAMASALQVLSKTLTSTPTPPVPVLADLIVNRALWEALIQALTALGAVLTTSANTPPGPSNLNKTKDFTAS